MLDIEKLRITKIYNTAVCVKTCSCWTTENFVIERREYIKKTQAKRAEWFEEVPGNSWGIASHNVVLVNDRGKVERAKKMMNVTYRVFSSPANPANGLDQTRDGDDNRAMAVPFEWIWTRALEGVEGCRKGIRGRGTAREGRHGVNRRQGRFK